MIGQFIFFSLFMVTLFAGAYVYLNPTQQTPGPLQVVKENGLYEPTEGASTKKYQQMSVTTRRGIVQIQRQINKLTREQKKLIAMVADDAQASNNTFKQITDTLKQANGKSDKDVLKFKALGLEMQDTQRLLVEHGQALIALNNQLTVSKQWLAEQNDLLSFDNEESLRLLQQHRDVLDDQSDTFFDRIKQQNNDFLEHTQDLIDEEHQKSQDRQNW